MRERLIIRLHAGDSSNVSWTVVSAGKTTLAEAENFGSLDEVAAVAQGHHVTLLAPGIETVISETAAPAVKKSRLQQIIGYALEESVAEDLSRLHFAIGDRNEEGLIPVATVSRVFMDHWRTAIRESGLHPHEILPELLCLPLNEGEWTVLIEPETVLVRTGAQSGFATDRLNLGVMIEHLLSQTPIEKRPANLRLFDYSGGTLDLTELEKLPADLELNFDDSAETLTPLQLLTTQIERFPSMNLLTGEYSLQREMSKIWSPWRTAAIFIGLVLLIQLMTSLIEIHKKEGLDRFLREEQLMAFRQAMPEVKNVRFPRRQLETQLRAVRDQQLTGSVDLLDVLSPIAPTLKSLNVDLLGMTFRSGNLDIEVSMKDLPAMENLKKKLQEIEGLQIEGRPLTTTGNRVEGTIRVRRQG
jgi:general secretion pathway protein L